MRLLKKNKKIIFVPLPRYICLACCDDKTHCVNRKEDGFINGLLEGLREIRREMKDACHDWKVANYKVVNGCTLLGLTEDSDYASWEAAMGTDPVHLTEGALGRVAGHTVKRPIIKSSLLRQMAPLEYINTLFKKSITKKPR